MSVAYTVALVVIARDEASRIARLLGSLRPWVDRMLVLDTGSVDDTVAIAQAHGAQVRNFGWCDDFAAARNAALDAAAADWHVVLDADEWLIDGGPALRALAQHSPDFVGQIELEDGFRDGPEWRIAHVPLSRVLPVRCVTPAACMSSRSTGCRYSGCRCAWVTTAMRPSAWWPSAGAI